MKYKLSAFLILSGILLCCTSCEKLGKEPEVYVERNQSEIPITLFTQNESVSEAIEDCCRNLLAQDKEKNLTLYTDSANFYADEGLSYRELLLKRFESSQADDLYLIPAEDVMEFDRSGYIYDLSQLDCVNNLSDDALIQSSYNGKIFSIPLSYTCFGFVWNVDMLERYGLKVPENLEEFLQVCETLKQNGILPYGANKDFALTVPAMCAGFSELYRSSDSEMLISGLSDGSTRVSEYMKDGFSFLQMMMDKGYMDREQALNMVPLSEEEKQFFADEKCAFYCAIYRAKTFGGYSFEIEMTPLPVISDGWACVVGADQRLAVNPNSEHLEDALAIVEMLGKEDSLDAFAAELGKISSSKNTFAPDIPQSSKIIASVAKESQIPNQDFRVHFNVWDNVRKLCVELCEGKSVEEVSQEYDRIQIEELSMYEK